MRMRPSKLIMCAMMSVFVWTGLGGLFAPSVMADDTLARFEGGIGVIPVSSAAGTQNTDGTFPNVNRNVVRGVNPAGQIWVIRDLNAKVKTNGEIKVEGEGLVLGGGNNVGRNTGQHVFATLICEAAAPFTEHNSEDMEGVALDSNGDFTIDGELTPIPPSDCASPVLLIRNVIGRTWFAAGILRQE
jgi:hypothetical protein